MRPATHKQKIGSLAAVAAASAFLAVPVWASPNTSQYGNPSTTTPTTVSPSVGGTKAAKVSKPSTKPKPAASAPLTTTRKASPGSLPFTGMDLTVAAFAGALLVLTGLVVRRLGRQPNDQ